jgi:hypothetical protein
MFAAAQFLVCAMQDDYFSIMLDDCYSSFLNLMAI